MPKTIRNKFEKSLTYDNMMKAHLKSQKGKRNRTNVIKFNLKQEEYIEWLYEQHSYACIKGKGMHRAALAVQKGMKECKKKKI